MNIEERIRTRREELNISQTELAKKLGYTSRSSICKIESGDRKLTASKIKKIADALETSPEWIMGWNDEVVKKTGNGNDKLTIIERQIKSACRGLDYEHLQLILKMAEQFRKDISKEKE